MRIAFVGGRGVIGTYSGIETYYEEVGSRLVDRGHRVTAYCRSYFTPPVRAHRGITVRRLPAIRTKHLETISHSLLSTVDCLLRDYDIVQYHAIGSSALAVLPRLFGKKTIVSVRGLDWQRAKWGSFATRVLQLAEYLSAKAPSATVVVSETLQRHYADRHHARTEAIPNAVVCESPTPLNRISEFGLAPDGYILFSGRISPEKEVHTLLKAFSGLETDKKLVLAGGSSHSDAYVEEVRAMAPENAIFLGRVGRDVMRELYSHCYAFVLPSTMEGLSIALLESLSYGNCIIATDIPENREVIGDAGLTFPVGSTAELTRLLETILKHPELVRERRQKASERARRWPDWDEIAERTERFYFRLLGRALTTSR